MLLRQLSLNTENGILIFLYYIEESKLEGISFMKTIDEVKLTQMTKTAG